MTPKPGLVVGSSAAGTVKRAALTSKGLKVKVTCSAACSYGVSLKAGSVAARKLRLATRKGSATLGTAKGTATATAKSVTVKLDTKARKALLRRLGHGASITLVLHVHARTGAGAAVVRDSHLVVRG